MSELCRIYADKTYLQKRLRSRPHKLGIVLDDDKVWLQKDLNHIINTCLRWLRSLLAWGDLATVGNIVKGKPAGRFKAHK